MVVVVRPEVHLARIHAVVRVGVRHTAAHGAGPRLAHWNHTMDGRVRGSRQVITRTNIMDHGLYTLAEPASLHLVKLVCARKSGF